MKPLLAGLWRRRCRRFDWRRTGCRWASSWRWGCRTDDLQRFNECEQLYQLIFADLALKRRHYLTKPFHQLCLRIYNRLANVSFICTYGFSTYKPNLPAEQTGECRTPAAFTTGSMTRYTAERLIELLAGDSWSSVARIAAEPVVKLPRFHNDNGPDHSRMVRPTILGAEQVKGAGLCSFKPLSGVLAWHHVGFHAKRGYEEIVNYVFRRHDQLDLTTHGDVKLVDLPLPCRMLNFPHPLFTNHVDFDGVLRRL